MAERFNLTAQLQLQAPTNVRQVASQIEKQLAPLGKIDVQVQADTRALSGANAQLNELNKAAKASNKSVSELNRTIAESARRFSVITVATGTLLGFVNSLKNSTKAAIEFEREVVKISQVTGKSASQLKSLTDEVTRLSTSLGASSADLLNVSRVLLQTGISADKTRQALDVLAKTSLGATFDSIQDTTEGAIALLRQFGGQARKTGREIEFLEQSLDAINAVSKNFAVESGDLVTAIRRVGGVFASAGGEVNELIALFTSVRATTRESAETIATGLRTIFTRIQRADTVNQLKELGIELQDAQGNFVGAFEAFKRLSQGLSALDPRSFRFSEIVEQLGGFRQVGKVIPLIQQFTTAQQALNVAQNSSGSVAKDAQTAQQSLAVQIQKTREQFDALIRKFADSSTFKSLASFSLQLAQSLIKVTEALEPLLPLLTSLLALKIGKGLGTGLGALASFGRGGGGAPVSRFARGGMVPGSGNTDSVPAMLTPGEFVIRKSSVKKLGASTLQQMNQNRFSKGKKVTFEDAVGGKGEFAFGQAKDLGLAKNATIKQLTGRDDSKLRIGGAFLKPKGLTRSVQAKISGAQIKGAIGSALGVNIGRGGIAAKDLAALGGEGDLTKGVTATILAGSTTIKKAKEYGRDIRNGLAAASEKFNTENGLPFGKNRFIAGYRKANPEQIEGNVFEAALAAASVGKYNNSRTNANALIDFPTGLGDKAAGFFGLPPDLPTDAKRSYNQGSIASLIKKVTADYLQTYTRNVAKANIKIGGKGSQNVEQKRLAGLASGGGISGSDTVPALLTPGEFVINKKAASRIGGANLNRMNKQGVQGFAKGGPVGFQNGGSVAGKLQNASFGALGLVALAQQFDVLSESTSELITQTTGYVAGVAGVAGTLSQLRENAVEAAAAKRVERQASDDAAAADRREAQASNQAAGKSQGKLGKLFDNSGKGVQAFGLAALAAGAVLQGFESSARQSAAEAEKALDGFAKSAKDTGAFNAKAVRDNVAKAANARNKAESLAAAKTVATYTSIGALVGGPFGAAIGFAIGVLTNFNAVVEGITSFLGFGNEAREAEIRAIQKSTEAYLQSIAQYSQINKDLESAESRVGATEQDKVKARAAASDQLLNAATSSGVASAQAILQKATLQTGKSLGELSSLSLPELEEALEGTGIAAKQFQVSVKATTEAIGVLKRAQQLSGDVLQSELQNAPIGKTFAELQQSGGSFAQALERYKNTIKATDIAELRAAQAAGATQDEQKALRQRSNKNIRELDVALEKSIKLRNEAAEQIRIETAIRAALIQKLEDQRRALQEVTEFSQGLTEQLRTSQNTTDIRAGRKPNLGFEELNFGENIGAQQVRQNLDKLNESIADLPKNIRDNVKKAGESLLNIRDIIEKARTKVLDAAVLTPEQLAEKLENEGALAPGKGLDQANTKLAAKSVLGIDIDLIEKEFGKAIADDLLLRIQNALAGGITEEEARGLIEPLKAANDNAAKTLDEANRARQTGLKIRQDIEKREIEQRQRIAENLQSLASNLEPINAAIARISGETAAESNIRLRTQAAQAGLDAGVGLRGGQQLIAGDSGQLSLAKEIALAERSRLEAITESGKDPTTKEALTGTQLDAYSKAIEVQKNIINDVNAEFLRLQDRTAQVAAIEERLAKGRKANEQAFAVLGEFVVGGKEARIALKEAATGILKATQTGTLQNQTAEQRAATVGLLDKISDVIIGNTGLTGREVKQELIFRDAVRLGFPPDIAKELATSASLEQQALDELKKQTALAQDAANRRAVGLAGGGSVAGAMFQPRGTDTVPAMLTPGEFVVRKSAVDKVGVGTLQAINSGTLYRQQGGIIPGAGNAVGSVNILPSGAFGQLFVNALSSAKTGNIKKALKSSNITGEESVEFLKAFNRAKKNREISKLASSPELSEAVNSTESYLNLLRGYAPTVFSKLDAKNQILNPYAGQTPKGKEAMNALASVTDSYLANTKGKALFANNLVSDFTGGLNVLKLVSRLPAILSGGGATGGGAAGGAAGGAGGGAAGGAQAAAAEKLKQARKNKLSDSGALPGKADITERTDRQISDLQYQLDLITEDGRIEIEKITDKAQRGRAKKLKQQIKNLQDANNARRKKIFEAGERAIARRKAEFPLPIDSVGDLPETAPAAAAPAAAAPAAAAPAADGRPDPSIFLPGATFPSPDDLPDPTKKYRDVFGLTQNIDEAGFQAYQYKLAAEDAVEQAAQRRTQDDLRRIRTELDASRTSREEQARQTSLSNRTQLGTAQETLDEVKRQRIAEFKRVGLNAPPGELDYLQIPEREKKPTGGGRVGLDYYDRSAPQTRYGPSEDDLERARLARLYTQGGLGKLEAIANGYFGPTGFANGGNVSGNDRVPAMLTPGEFVMSPEAVNRYGVGYMKNLNRGRVPGFRRGGIVGRGNVQYRQNGGGIADSNAMMSLDASNIQSVLETFNQEFQATLDTVVGQFSSLTSAMNNLAGVFSKGFTMTHTFTGDMSMAFKIDNLPELQQAIAKAITPTITEQIEKTIKEQSKGFKSGG